MIMLLILTTSAYVDIIVLSCCLPILLSMHDVCMPYALPFFPLHDVALYCSVIGHSPRYSDPESTMLQKVKQVRVQAHIRQQPMAGHSVSVCAGGGCGRP